MTDSEMRKLNRVQLLELMIQQGKELENLKADFEKEITALKAENASLKNQLEDRRIKIDEVGSLAEASLAVNQVVEAAQKAADQYLENIRMLNERQESIVQEKMEKVTGRCATISVMVQKRCDSLMEETKKQCAEMEASTTERCEKMLKETQETCAHLEQESEERRRAKNKALNMTWDDISVDFEKVQADLMDMFRVDKADFMKSMEEKIQKKVDEDTGDHQSEEKPQEPASEKTDHDDDWDSESVVVEEDWDQLPKRSAKLSENQI